jgi:hypothetical protein
MEEPPRRPGLAATANAYSEDFPLVATRLTMLEIDPEGLRASFYAFQSLLQRKGWKTLIYISKNPGHIHHIELHGCAEKILQTEETASGTSFHSEGLGSTAFFQMKSLSSGASFQVFRAVSTSALGSIINSRNRELYPKNKGSREKGIMIVATRGIRRKQRKTCPTIAKLVQLLTATWI